jgi:ankyrin repeat protein
MIFSSLPNEIIFQVLSHLDYQSELNAVAQTCKFLSALANNALYSQLPERISGFTLESLVKQANADALLRLIEHGVKINSVTRDREAGNLTAYAATNGHLEIVRLLSDQEPLSIYSSSPKTSPLLCALLNEHVDIAHFLISRGAKAESLHSLDEGGALSHAIRFGSLNTVRYLIDEMLFDVNQHTEVTPLRESIQNGHWDIAQYLLQAGANPMLDDSEQSNPLLLEVARRSDFDKTVVLVLLEKIETPKLEDTQYWRDLVEHGDKQMISLIMENLDLPAAVEEYGTHVSLLVLAAAAGNEGLLQYFINAGSLAISNVSFTQQLVAHEYAEISGSWLPLQWAVRKDNIGCVDVLLDVCSKVLSTNQLKELISRTCLQATRSMKYHVARHLLCKYPHDFVEFKVLPRPNRINDSYSRFVLDCDLYRNVSPGTLKGRLGNACGYGNASAVNIWLDILERRGIETRIRNTHYSDLLDSKVSQLFESVAYLCNFEVFKLLLKRMNIELCPSSPAHQQMLSNFVTSGEADVVRLFLDKGFDVNAMYCDQYGRLSSLLVTAASCTGADEHVELMIQLLLDRGALVDATDHTRVTALTYATEGPRLGVIDMLLDRGANPIFGLGERITPLEIAAREFQSDVLRKFLDVMIARKLKFDNIMSLLPSRHDDSVDWIVDTAKALTQYHWRCMYPV